MPSFRAASPSAQGKAIACGQPSRFPEAPPNLWKSNSLRPDRLPPEVPRAPQRNTRTNLKHNKDDANYLHEPRPPGIDPNIYVWHPTCTSISRLTAEPGLDWSGEVIEFCQASTTTPRSNRSHFGSCSHKNVFLLVMLGNP
jgi:hypothetical protein